MSRISLAAAAGLAVATGASADVMFTFAGPTQLGALQSVELFSGNLSGSADTFAWSFDFTNAGDLSWASDFQIAITAANGNSVTIGGLTVGDLATPYQGQVSQPSGTYGGNLNIAGFNLGGSGLWTVEMTNTWTTDPNPDTIANFSATLGGSVVPAPAALGLFGIAGLAATRRRR